VSPAKKVERWVCDQCGAIHFPAVVDALHKCPSCGNPSGKLKDLGEEELNK